MSKNIISNKLAQQEMVGFILIVVIVIVAMMVFLVISASRPLVEVKSPATRSLLSNVLEYTTQCIVSEPYLLNVMELVIACHEGKRCNNLDKMACNYLNETITEVMESLTQTDATIISYQITAYWEKKDEEKSTAFYILSTGDCVGGAKLQGENTPIDSSLRVALELCIESDS